MLRAASSAEQVAEAPRGPVEDPDADVHQETGTFVAPSTPASLKESPPAETSPNGGDRLKSSEDEPVQLSAQAYARGPAAAVSRAAEPESPYAPGQTTSENIRLPEHAPDDADHYLGSILGSYRVLALIGRGGMGQVYLAEHTKLGRRVALKLLLPEYTARRDAVSRFCKEARAVNTIAHKNIVDVTDLVQLESGETFIIMELLRGESLGQLLRRTPAPPPLRFALRVAMQVCEGLAAAHEAGIIHRDLKPDNVFLVPVSDGTSFVKLLDFGVAKLQLNLVHEGDYHTAAGSVIGTPGYMAPEQAAGIPVDHRCDIYALGLILYELFTGQRAFHASSFGEYVVRHINEDPIPPSMLAGVPRLPSELERVVMRCLSKKPQDRYGSAEDVRAALAAIHSRASPPAEDRPKWWHRRPFVLAIALSLAVLSATGFWLASGLGTHPKEREQQVAAEGAVEAPLPAWGRGGSGAEAKRSVQLTLRSDPAGARIYELRPDGRRISRGVTPLTLVSRDAGEELRLLFRKPGFIPVEENVPVMGPTLVSVTLAPRDDSRTTPRARRRSASEGRRGVRKSRRAGRRKPPATVATQHAGATTTGSLRDHAAGLPRAKPGDKGTKDLTGAQGAAQRKKILPDDVLDPFEE